MYASNEDLEIGIAAVRSDAGMAEIFDMTAAS